MYFSISISVFGVLFLNQILSASSLNDDKKLLATGTHMVRNLNVHSQIERVAFNKNVGLKSEYENLRDTKEKYSIWKKVMRQCGFSFPLVIPVMVPSVTAATTTTTTTGAPDARS